MQQSAYHVYIYGRECIYAEREGGYKNEYVATGENKSDILPTLSALYEGILTECSWSFMALRQPVSLHSALFLWCINT